MAAVTNTLHTKRLTMKIDERRHRALADMVFVKNMSRAMLRVGEQTLKRLSNGFRPIDDARPAHGSGLA
jgi:hypothetical protein